MLTEMEDQPQRKTVAAQDSSRSKVPRVLGWEIQPWSNTSLPAVSLCGILPHLLLLRLGPRKQAIQRELIPETLGEYYL
jgi:hypothetical protein